MQASRRAPTHQLVNELLLRRAVRGFLVLDAFDEVRVVAALAQLHLHNRQAGHVALVAALHDMT